MLSSAFPEPVTRAGRGGDRLWRRGDLPLAGFAGRQSVVDETAARAYLPPFVADVQERPDIAIIGPGKVGRAIGILAGRAGWRVVSVGGRDPARAERAAAEIPAPAKTCSPIEAAATGALVLLTVPDEVIEPLCRELAVAGGFKQGAVVGHCSGALDSEVLAPARERCGCAVGSMHPLQTFPTAAAAVERFPGTHCFCEGDERAAEVLEALAAAMGGLPVRIASAAKPLYHAAAVMACNYLVAMLDAAGAAGEAAGIDPATFRAAMAPIARATVENVLAMGSAAALTGPIARGDAETVRRHLAAMTGEPRLARLYRAAGEWTVALAQRKGTIDAEAAGALRRVLGARVQCGPSGPACR